MIYEYNDFRFINTKTKKQEWTFTNRFLDEDVEESKVKKELDDDDDDDEEDEDEDKDEGEEGEDGNEGGEEKKKIAK
jgi:hypothetical protein